MHAKPFFADTSTSTTEECVLYSDYQTLQARCRELEECCRHLAKSSHSMNMWIKDGCPVEVADNWEAAYEKAMALVGEKKSSKTEEDMSSRK